MSDKVTVDISPIANSITVAPVTTSVEISQNTTTVELKNVTYENNISQTVTNVDITPTTTTVEATVNTTTVDISPNTTTVGVGDASIVSSNLAVATNITHDSNSWITGGNVQASFDNLATTADSRYVNVTGDTMTGTLTATGFIGNVTGQVSDLSNHTFFSGSYDDLDDKPTLFDGVYNSLTGKPTLFSGSYDDLDDKPTLFDGAYNSLSGKPTLFDGAYNSLSGKPTLFDGAYASLSNKPTLVTSIDGLSDVDITTNTPTNNQVLVWNTNKFVPADQSAAGVDLTAFSVGSPATADGSGGLAYNNSSGVFTYTPPNLSSYLTSETTTSLALESNVLKYTDEEGTENEIDISLYLDDTNLARLTSGTLDSSNGTATFTRSDSTTFTVDFSSLINSAEVNDLSSSVTWANVPNANITEGSVTQHQAALSVTESQISDLGSYLTSETSHTDVLVDGDFTSNGLMKRTGDGQYAIDSSTYITDYTVTQSDVTAHQAALSVTESQISDLGTYLTNIEGQDLKDLADVTYSGTPRNHSLLVYNPLVTGGGTNANKWTVGTNVAIDSIESDLSPNSTSATYQVYKTLVDESGSTDLAYLTIGGAPSGSYGNTNNLFDRVELRAGSDGIRMHWYENSESVAGQTERFHTTNRGIHVGDDRTGTYTAGDLMQNADLDYGMLVGRESINTGSNNFGFGFKHSFGTGTSSNIAVGSLHQCTVSGSENNMFAGGDNRLTTSGDFNFCGGVRTSTRNNNNFTWAEGVIGDNDVRYAAQNYGTGCVLFGKQTKIDGNSSYSLVGGRLDPISFTETEASDLDYGILWGKACRSDNADGSINVGATNYIHDSHGSACFGEGHVLGNQSTVKNNMLVAGYNNDVEGSDNFCVGRFNNIFGSSAAAIGRSLKTPLFQDVVDGSTTSDYSFDDFSVVVGAYNKATEKYVTDHTNTPAQTWITDHRFVVGTGTDTNAKANGFIVAVSTDDFSGIIMPALAASNSHSSGSVAKANGVPVGGLYHTNGVVKVLLDSD